MNSQIKIINAKLIGYQGLQQINIDDRGAIEKIVAQENGIKIPGDREIDVNGDWISLGGIDLQINGALGLAFPNLEEKDLPCLEKIAQFLYSQGIDGFVPTIVTTSIEKIQRSLLIFKQFIETKQQQKIAQILGVHLEGPFLDRTKRGAHPAEYLLPLNIANLDRVLGEYSSIVKIITLAPELDVSDRVIPYLKSLGIVVSLGHSQATKTQARKAFNLGASMVTHAFNAMPSLHHREPGLLGEAIINPNIYCGLIADGEHICPTMIEILIKASDYDRGIFLVSDALAPIGLHDGIYPWDNRTIEVKNGVARLEDGTLAGTTLPLLVGVENLVKWGTCRLEQAIAMATESPRRAIGMSGIAIGQPAQFLRWQFDRQTDKLTWKRIDLKA